MITRATTHPARISVTVLTGFLGTGKITVLLVGTSGVSNPWPVAETFVTGRARRRFQLHSILTVVDAEQARRLAASVSRSIGERVRERFAMLRHRLQPLVCRGDDHAC